MKWNPQHYKRLLLSEMTNWNGILSVLFCFHQDINYTSNWQEKACIFGWIWLVNNLQDCFHYIISSQSLQPREETITKTAFDHNKIIELNFRLICKLQQNRCQSSKNSTISQGILQSFVVVAVDVVFACNFFSKFSLFFFCCAASFRMRPVIHLCCCCFWLFANLCAIVDVLIIQTFNNIYQF